MFVAAGCRPTPHTRQEYEALQAKPAAQLTRADKQRLTDLQDQLQQAQQQLQRAQAAAQQANWLAKALPTLTAGGDAAPYRYRDQGSLVSLSDYSSVGSLMGSLTRGSMFIEGQIAKLMYWGLHKQHQFALGGLRKTLLITLSEWIDRTHRPRIKLH